MQIPVLSILTLIFVTLKIMGEITWSWWLVLAPTWIPMVIGIVIVTAIAIWALKNE